MKKTISILEKMIIKMEYRIKFEPLTDSSAKILFQHIYKGFQYGFPYLSDGVSHVVLA